MIFFDVPVSKEERSEDEIALAVVTCVQEIRMAQQREDPVEMNVVPPSPRNKDQQSV